MKRGIIHLTETELILLFKLAQQSANLHSVVKRLENTNATDLMLPNDYNSKKISVQLSENEVETILDELGLATTESEKGLRTILLNILEN